jgi:hypothetical protein
MTKIVTVQCQQRWEYYFETRRTEASLVVALNELGQQGWEAVSVTPYKDAKGVAAWGAYLKRPSAGPAVQAGQSGIHTGLSAVAATASAASPPHDSLHKFDLSGDEFQLKSERAEDKAL